MGQAVRFAVDDPGQEEPVDFAGLVGKIFRPPELCLCRPLFSGNA